MTRPRFATSVLRPLGLAAALALLGHLGCLDRDEGHGLYVFDSRSKTVLVWKDLEKGHHNQRPNRVLAGAPRDLRILAHPWQADWLLGAGSTRASRPARDPDERDAGAGRRESSQGRGQASLTLWKDPHEGAAPVTVTLPGVQEIRGVAAGAE